MGEGVILKNIFKGEKEMKKIRKISVATAVLLLLLTLLASCSKAGDSYDNEVAPMPEKDGFVGDTSAGADNNATSDLIDLERKIIKNVNESVQTDEYDAFVASVAESVASVGGYISSKEEYGESYYHSQTLRSAYYTIRIPAERLDEFTKTVDGLAVVTSYNESMRDVTEAYVDVESRITVYESERVALLEMLEKSTDVNTLLEIRTRLLAVEADLASLKAQKQSYDSRIAYSTVYLRVSEVRRAVSENPGFFEEIGNNFIDSVDEIGEGIRDFAVWLVGDILYIVLVLSAGTGIFFLARFLYRKHRAKSRKKQRESAANPPSDAAIQNNRE